jgi:hypothetical protein
MLSSHVLRTVGWAALLIGTTGLTGCSPGEARVEGTVRYAGKPLPLGSIAFVPMMEGGVARGGRIEQGVYKTERGYGPVPGEYRVEIRWVKPTGKKYKNEFGEEHDVMQEGLPDKYHANSTLTTTIKPGSNVLDFDLEK